MTSGCSTIPCCCTSVGNLTCQATRPDPVTSVAKALLAGQVPASDTATLRAAADDAVTDDAVTVGAVTVGAVAAGPAALVVPQATAQSRTAAAAQPTAKAGPVM
jgi:hypothetical protein